MGGSIFQYIISSYITQLCIVIFFMKTEKKGNQAI